MLDDYDYVVVMDHRDTRLFHLDANDYSPQKPPRKPYVITPNDSHGFLQYLEHLKKANHQGRRVEESHDYFERIAVALKSAARIVLFTHGDSKSNAGHYFVEYLKLHHPDLARHVVAEIDADLSHMADGEIVAAAGPHLPETVG